MTDDTATIILMVIAFIAGLLTGLFSAQDIVQTQAIEHNAAHYNTTTGDFTWNEEE